MQLHKLQDIRGRKKVQRVGRGPGSKRGKTSCRGQKGDGSRSGYKRRYGYEGGGVPLHRRLPIRGFTRGRFFKARLSINLDLIEKFYNDGETVSHQTLYQKGIAPRALPGGLKILSRGELTKKVTIEAKKFSKEAIKKLDEKKISYQTV